MPKKFKVFVDLPNYIHSSNGTRCIKELIKEFAYYKISTIKISRDISLINRLKQSFFLYHSRKIAYLFKTKANIGDYFLACDTTPIHLIKLARKNNLKIIWWQLAPYRFLGGKQIPKDGEYSLPFSSYVDPISNIFFYYQPKIDKEWENALKKMDLRNKKKYYKLCVYTGKGRICSLNKDIRDLFPNYKIEIITRVTPKSRLDYFNLLVKSDGLISFDEMTQTNLEAASLGLPVYIANPLFPKRCSEKFIIKEINQRLIRSPKRFLKIINSKNNIFLPLKINYLESYNNETIKRFLELIEGKSNLKTISKEEIKTYNSYSKKLLSKKILFPFVNSGQSPSSLLIKIYLKNLHNHNKYKLINLLLIFIDHFGLFLKKLGLIRIVEIIFIKLNNLKSKKRFEVFFNFFKKS